MSVALPPACGAVTAPAGQSPVGYWYEEGQPDDPNVLTIVHFDVSGRFDVHFRMCHGHDQADDIETGVWIYANGINDMVTLTANGGSAYRDDRYDTVKLDATHYVYRHERTGYVFKDVRVDAKSDVPSCESTS